MNEQDQKILELYLKDVRKKKIIVFIVIIIILFICIIFSKLYTKNMEQISNVNNEIIMQEESNQNFLNDVTNNVEETTSQTISEVTEENIQNDVVVETQETNEKNNTNIEKEVEKPQPTTPTQSNEKKEEHKTQKPSNKDFLFTEGYTMENVSQAAQDYLKSSGFAGECVPLKDSDGVYLGMRVIFH